MFGVGRDLDDQVGVLHQPEVKVDDAAIILDADAFIVAVVARRVLWKDQRREETKNLLRKRQVVHRVRVCDHNACQQNTICIMDTPTLGIFINLLEIVQLPFMCLHFGRSDYWCLDTPLIKCWVQACFFCVWGSGTCIVLSVWTRPLQWFMTYICVYNKFKCPGVRTLQILQSSISNSSVIQFLKLNIQPRPFSWTESVQVLRPVAKSAHRVRRRPLWSSGAPRWRSAGRRGH